MDTRNFFFFSYSSDSANRVCLRAKDVFAPILFLFLLCGICPFYFHFPKREGACKNPTSRFSFSFSRSNSRFSCSNARKWKPLWEIVHIKNRSIILFDL